MTNAQHKLTRLISSASDWKKLKSRFNALTKKEKGDAFELFIKYYLQSHPEYTSTLKNVWLFSELSPRLKRELGIPSNDQGIDLVAKTNTGEFWAIQCKYLEDENQRLSHEYISTFGNLAFAVSDKFSFGLVCTTADRFSKVYSEQKLISFCTSEVWQNLTQEQFKSIRALAVHKPVKLKAYKPFPHQQRAVRNAVKHYITNKESRGKLILPCGSGKSLTGYWIARALKAKSIVVAVPSLALVRQTLNTWLRESIANNLEVDWVCVCSDESIAKQDDTSILVQDLGIPSVTDVKYLAKWLKKKTSKIKIVFTTYQSGLVIAQAAKNGNFQFDLGIMDEAHKTVGQKDKLFSHLLYEKNIRIKKRVFMTATERRYLGSSDELASMDNPAIYGETFELLSFKQALEIKPPILSDYKIITLAVAESELQELIKKNIYVRPDKGLWNKEVEAQTLTALIALRKAMNKYPINHAVSFHSSIARAKAFEETQARVTEIIPEFGKIDSFHVTGATPTSERSKTLNEFSKSKKALITNARCLTEGVDVPNIDCVLFADPKKSTIDIVQAVGRALRISNGKKYGYVIIPVLSERNDEEQVINNESYGNLMLTLRSLASNDERIIDYFRLKNSKLLPTVKKSLNSDLIEFYGEKIDLKSFADEVELRAWSRLGKLSWKPFEEARSFVHALNLRNNVQWREYCKYGNKPLDIPTTPNEVYGKSVWRGYGDWLGTGVVAPRLRTYRSFEEAKKFVRKLNLKSVEEWEKYSRSGEKPDDIPSIPRQTYLKSGWRGYGDWLGNRTKKYAPFKEAKKFVHGLRLKSVIDWQKYCGTGKKPIDIPSAPNRIYKNVEWKNWGDWLGTVNISNSNKRFLAFSEAKKFVSTLRLANGNEWRAYCASGKKPVEIPSAPDQTYNNKGWVSWGDWLGTGKISPQLRKYRGFYLARKFARSLKFRNVKQWREYCKSTLKPSDIPSKPHQVYLSSGWIDWYDWLGR